MFKDDTVHDGGSVPGLAGLVFAPEDTVALGDYRVSVILQKVQGGRVENGRRVEQRDLEEVEESPNLPDPPITPTVKGSPALIFASNRLKRSFDPACDIARFSLSSLRISAIDLCDLRSEREKTLTQPHRTALELHRTSYIPVLPSLALIAPH